MKIVRCERCKAKMEFDGVVWRCTAWYDHPTKPSSFMTFVTGGTDEE